MKVLIVSGQKYSKTNRSIDTITEYFIEKKYEVEHLVFGINKLKEKKNKNQKLNIENFKQLYSYSSYFSYLGIMGKLFPKILLEYIKFRMIETVKFIDFKSYDLIILETGKPLFLLDLIPKDILIVCRQSDPLDISIRSERKYFQEMERQAFERSIFSLIAHKKTIEEYKDLKNLFEWKSGFESKIKEKIIKNPTEKKILSYMGMFKIDFKLIKEIALKNPNCEIHIIGNYKNCLKLKNVIFHGYLKYEKYIEILKITDCFIVPYHLKEVKRMRKLGLTSKYYIPMSLGIPILTRSYGEVLEDIEKFNIFTYNSKELALKKLKIILNKNYDLNTNIEMFLEDLKIENRKKELEKIMLKYNVVK